MVVVRGLSDRCSYYTGIAYWTGVHTIPDSLFIRQVFIFYRISYWIGVHTIPDSLLDRCSYYTG